MHDRKNTFLAKAPTTKLARRSAAEAHPLMKPTPHVLPLDLPPGTALMLFDGDCGLCQRSVHFLLDRDRARRFRFAALQSALGHAVVRSFGRDPARLDTVCLVDRGRSGALRLATRGAAVRRMLWKLSWRWRLLALPLWIVPRFLLDRAYDVVAKRRLRLFGRADACRLPRPGDLERFLDRDPG